MEGSPNTMLLGIRTVSAVKQPASVLQEGLGAWAHSLPNDHSSEASGFTAA